MLRIQTAAHGEMLVLFKHASHAATSQGRSLYATICCAKRLKDLAPRALAEAHCSPRDNFNRRIGRRIAFGRMLKRLKLERLERREAWIAYWEHFSQDLGRL